ncbi:hypothetical protein SCD_n00273 [Sulfuricella denitrificans skB26]|uniref:Uncharacterized protein n=1 Tax=Sulfuricella denitrificans (strain DSM 22764 / NBRC 105220 / skB26) TaxID=1163617 RepID=S6B057_SULDS|nr:hypothetical protein SCD_n00273 [Sulfuricella denitrificans skB26]
MLRVVENASQGCRVIKITVPAKLATRASALEFFSKSLALDLAEGLASLAAMDKRSEKTLVLVDEAHNLFLAKPGGSRAIWRSWNWSMPIPPTCSGA